MFRRHLDQHTQAEWIPVVLEKHKSWLQNSLLSR